jgi:hypothetical protein
LYTNNKKDSNFLLKEAELIISNCIRDSKKKEFFSKEPTKKKENAVKNNSVNIVINTILICSIAVLIFVISKMI